MSRNNPHAAFMQSMDVHIDDHELALVEEDRTQIRREQAKQNIKFANIGSLATHPGWKAIRAEFEEDIAAFRSGRVLRELALDGKTTDEQLGQSLRVMMLVADRLEKRVQEVEIAGEEVAKQQKAAGEQRRVEAARRVATGRS